MSKKTRAQNREIVSHVLGVLQVDETTIKAILEVAKIDTIVKLRDTAMDTLQKFSDKGLIAAGDILAIQSAKKWAESRALPADLEEWKKSFTEDSLLQLGEEQESRIKKEKNESLSNDKAGSGSANQVGKMQVKIADYPEFLGRHSEWYSFKDMFEATALAHGYADLLEVVDDDAHLQLRREDTDYDGRVRALHAILRRKTAKGTASSKIKKYAGTSDGALAWRMLKQYYNQEGSKSLYASKCLTELTKLFLDGTMFGELDNIIMSLRL